MPDDTLTPLQQLEEKHDEAAGEFEAAALESAERLRLAETELTDPLAWLQGHGLRELVRLGTRASAWQRVSSTLRMAQSERPGDERHALARVVMLCDQLDDDLIKALLAERTDPIEQALLTVQRAANAALLKELRILTGNWARFWAQHERRLKEAEVGATQLGVHPETGEVITVRDYLLLQLAEYTARLRATSAVSLIQHLKVAGIKYAAQDKETMVQQLVAKRCPPIPPLVPVAPEAASHSPSPSPSSPPRDDEVRLHEPEGPKDEEAHVPSPVGPNGATSAPASAATTVATTPVAAPRTRRERSAMLAAAAEKLSA